MKKPILFFLLLASTTLLYAQSLVIRSGLHQEVYQIPINHDMISHTKTITAAPIDILYSMALNDKIDFMSGIKFVPYENRVKILPPDAFKSSGSVNWLYSTLGIPVTINTKLLNNNNRFNFYIATGVVPSYTIRETSVTFTSGSNGFYDLSEKQRFNDNKFNLLLNTGIGTRINFKYFEIGLIAEYCTGLIKTYTSEINVIGLLPESKSYYYQITSKGDYWGLNLEIIYPINKILNKL